jgi:hypothetical protein
VEHLYPAVGWMRSGHQSIRLRVADQFERLVRERDRPRFAELFHHFGEDEAEGDAASIQVVVAERIVDVDLVPEIKDCVAAQLGEGFGVRPLAERAFETQLLPRCASTV